VSAKGGELQVLTLSDTSSGEIALYGPELLPDGNTLLIDVSYTDGEEGLLLLSEDTRIPIHRERGTIAYPAYSPTGHILFQRDWPVSEGIWALPFDVSTMTVTGDPFPVASGGSAPSLSEDGTLVYRSGSGVGAMRQLVWVDRTGTVQDTIGQPQDEITSPALSPDGRFVAVWGTDEDETDIWLHDVTRGTKTPLSYDIPNTWRPSWSPDGDRIVFQSRDPAQNFKSDLYMQTTDGRSPPEPLVKTDADEYGPHWSPDGKTILYTVTKPDGDRDLWMLSLSDPKTPQPFLSTPFDERNPFFSPDGRYVAYQSNKSGRAEIYVTRFPDAEGEWMVSVDGGVSAQWLGGEIFYVDLETNTLMVAQARTYPAFHAELPRTVFSGESINAALATPGTFNYTVSSDGQRFVVVQQADAGETPKLTVVQNWSAEFKERE
jgi:serine/threonine-protein kinase